MYEDLEQLANLKIGKAIDDASKKVEPKRQAAVADLAHRGLARYFFTGLGLYPVALIDVIC